VLVGKGFEDYFVANAIDVALCDAYFKFFFHVCYFLMHNAQPMVLSLGEKCTMHNS
jgi:hypothetical protein